MVGHENPDVNSWYEAGGAIVGSVLVGIWRRFSGQKAKDERKEIKTLLHAMKEEAADFRSSMTATIIEIKDTADNTKEEAVQTRREMEGMRQDMRHIQSAQDTHNILDDRRFGSLDRGMERLERKMDAAIAGKKADAVPKRS